MADVAPAPGTVPVLGSTDNAGSEGVVAVGDVTSLPTSSSSLTRHIPAAISEDDAISSSHTSDNTGSTSAKHSDASRPHMAVVGRARAISDTPPPRASAAVATTAAAAAAAAAVVPTGPGAHVHHAHHGSGETGISLHVCAKCEQALSHAFEHCLSKRITGGAPGTDTGIFGGGGLLSVHHIDEDADGEILTEPPFFDIIADPTRSKNTLYADPADRVARDKAVRAAVAMHSTHAGMHAHQKHARGASTTAGNGVLAAGGAGSPAHPPTRMHRSFAGSLYKAVLQAKDREIEALRRKLYDASAAERHEHANNARLKGALAQSMKYYAFAEEWQQSESARLQRDIKFLKAEFSSLMAYLVNSEEEKRMLLVQLSNAHKTVKERDERVLEHQKQIDDLKEKLHVSFKEFLTMNDTVAKLKIEAERGTETMVHRNEILQRNLDRITRDFDTASRDLNLARTRIKELEFELTEVITQFNATGDAKKKEEEINARLTAEVTSFSAKLRETQTNNENLILQNIKLESDLKYLKASTTETRVKLEAQVETLTADLEKMTSLKTDFETQSKQLKAENDRLKTALTAMTRAKDQLESQLRAVELKAENDVMQREATIRDITAQLDDERAKHKKCFELKDQLLFKVTDLQNALDREQATCSMLTLELQAVKRGAEEKRILLEEQIEKLNLARQNLLSDKKFLESKMKELKEVIELRDLEISRIKIEFAEYKDKSVAEINDLESQVAKWRQLHEEETVKRAAVEVQRDDVEKVRDKLLVDIEAVKVTRDQLASERERHLAEIESLRVERASLETRLAQAVAERDELAVLHGNGAMKIKELMDTITQNTQEYEAVIREKDRHISRLTAQVTRLTTEVEQFDTAVKKLIRKNQVLMDTMKDLKQRMIAETVAKDELEALVDELRQRVYMERKSRLEMEKIHGRIDKRVMEKELEKVTYMRLRDRKLHTVNSTLVGEYNRLNGLGALVREVQEITPTASGSNAVDQR